MSVQAEMETKLKEALKPQRMQLVNESHNHSVPKQSETHFNLIIVAEAFVGKSPIQRHRQIYAALGEELKAGVHALTMKTLTPQEWDDAGGEVENPAPLCHGGTGK
jgi:BolA protein